jgi:DNA-binding response OmpR family regulator
MDTQNKICIIEDNIPIRKLFSTILKRNGYTIIDFGNGKDALEWFKNNLPMCVLVDILLPDISGTEILKEIRKLKDGEKITVIAATGFAQASDRDKYLEMGFDAYIAKPINTATFASEIKEAMEAKNNS